MKCPIDNETLVMTDRNGVEIDYCPKCRGVWLDRGELDKIIEKSAGKETSRAHDQGSDRGSVTGDRHGSVIGGLAGLAGNRQQGHQGKRKESFLSELFDF